MNNMSITYKQMSIPHTHARTHTHAEKQHLHPINRDDLVGAKKAGDPYMGPVSVYVSQ